MAEFGQAFTTQMVVSNFQDNHWTAPEVKPIGPFSFHPGTHVLHYSSTCFEGLKAYRWTDGSIHLFRYQDNIRRLRNSAAALCLPVPSDELLEASIFAAVKAVVSEIPDLPGALYIRPTLIGTELNIGAAGRGSKEALLYVITSPVGDYFAGGIRPLKLLIDDENMRSTPKFGQVKTGGNYAASLGSVTQARAEFGADQVLFCPGGQVQETGAANFILLKGNEVITKKLDGSILPGITRDSILKLAAEQGYQIKEIDYTVDELLAWLPESEAFLSGTAAVLSPVGSLIYHGKEYLLGDGKIGEKSVQLKAKLTGIQTGKNNDTYRWTTVVE
ncbi:branched-chain amino acid aminotransferase [Marinicella litoralis]|uniref:Branched-chain-amino-acid aminotransferase n=1 Tax=Marinicella litoralis TaxID=644220 RepID=A0A4V3DI61_9GAMM|nr:branched-chain amino acid aminotransferase [Marinicella litoralis]TDR20861.1 branched-chain amino acid aminotransferase [Marinicella litoralis]